MRLNRRNVLIGLGTVAVGSGAALGSGAFTQVSAERTMNISASDDSAAYLQLTPDATSFVSTTTGNNGQAILQIDLADLNDDATTTLSPAFTITNGLSNGVGVRVRSDAYSGGEPAGLTIESNTNNQNLDTYPGASGDDNNLDPNGGTDDNEPVNIIIDTSTLDVTTVSSITIEADTSQYIP